MSNKIEELSKFRKEQIKPTPHKRIQTAEGWKRSKARERQSSKIARKS